MECTVSSCVCCRRLAVRNTPKTHSTVCCKSPKSADLTGALAPRNRKGRYTMILHLNLKYRQLWLGREGMEGSRSNLRNSKHTYRQSGFRAVRLKYVLHTLGFMIITTVHRWGWVNYGMVPSLLLHVVGRLMWLSMCVCVRAWLTLIRLAVLEPVNAYEHVVVCGFDVSSRSLPALRVLIHVEAARCLRII